MQEKAPFPQHGKLPGPAGPAGEEGACPEGEVSPGPDPGLLPAASPGDELARDGEAPLGAVDTLRGDTAQASPQGNDGTVGELPTVGPSVPEGVVGWKKGMVIADRFEIEAFIGQGGMGTVYLATDLTLKRPIALKCVPQEILFDGDARDDLRQEANRLLDLAHENVVRIHTYYDASSAPGGRPPGSEGWPFFAMEYLQGPTLKQLLRQRRQAGRPFSEAEVLFVARLVARGLAYAHSKGVIHRDLKPGNLMLVEAPQGDLGERDVVKITDFGISRVIEDTKQRHTGKRSGTLPYMSPEQFRGEPSTVQSDIYSLACTLYELLGGQPPFHSGDIGYQILHKAPRPLPGATRTVNDALLRGLEKEPQDRFDSVISFLRALEGRRSTPRPSTSRALKGVGAVVAGVLVVLSLAAFLSPGGTRDPSARPAAEAAADLRARLPAPTEERQAELQEFRKRLQAELERQIPFQIGRDLAFAASSHPDALSLRLAIQEPRASSFQRTLLDELIFLRYGESPESRDLLTGTLAEGAKLFELGRLREGPHSLRAYLQKPGGLTEELFSEPYRFRIDLTPPSFQVLPVHPEAFLESAPPYRLTFDEVVQLKLVTTRDAGDLAEAYTTIVFGEGTRPWERLQKLPFWTVELPPGSTTTYRVYARDAAGNRSAAQEISLQRLRLDVERFALVPEGMTGNQVQVEGLVRVEGDQSPSLKYFVNERLAEPLTDAALRPTSLPRPRDGRQGAGVIPFSAALLLPQAANNTIEVRYAWRDNPPQPFARPARITDVKLVPPRIALDPLPQRTSQERVRLSGRVDPFFEGLQVAIEQRGRGSRNLTLATGAVAGQASFADELELLDGENSFLLNAYYRDESLGSPLPGLTVTVDRTPPDCDGPARIDLLGNTLVVAVRVTEELKRFRVHEVWATGESSAWRTLEPDSSGRHYSFLTPLPARPFTFKFEMTDLADNEAVSDQLWNAAPGGAGVARAIAPDGGVGVAPGAHGEGGALEVAAASPGLLRGVTVIASGFVAGLGMEFVPVGQGRLEICRTETPEAAWILFLRESRHVEPAGPGRQTSPLRLEDSSPELVREFVRWFSEKAQDGYRYDVPTVEEWTAGFAGVGDAALARDLVKAWFVGVLAGGKRFRPYPAVPYGDGAAGEIGARPENAAPSGLLDMEASVQELVQNGEGFKVLGGSNADSLDRLLERCSEPRPYDAARRAQEGRWTGLRLVRRPAGGGR